MIILAQILLHELFYDLLPFFGVAAEIERNMKTEKEKLDQMSREKEDLQRDVAVWKQQEQVKGEERELQMKELKEKLGQTEGELSRITERSVELERQVAELKAYKNQTQVTDIYNCKTDALWLLLFYTLPVNTLGWVRFLMLQAQYVKFLIDLAYCSALPNERT